jgi:hypothetical protein
MPEAVISGKPIAVMISPAKCQHAFTEAVTLTLVSAFRRWREQYPEVQGFTDAEQAQIHQRTRELYPETTAIWD